MGRIDPDALRNTLLDAAEAVVVEQGIASLTLDAVAREAGMSKGGLLHYFPSKDRLVEALVMRSADGWRGCYLAAYERTPGGPGRVARAAGPLPVRCQQLDEGAAAQLVCLFRGPGAEPVADRADARDLGRSASPHRRGRAPRRSWGGGRRSDRRLVALLGPGSCPGGSVAGGSGARRARGDGRAFAVVDTGRLAARRGRLC
jgi:AcrR family transcriptional regulator